MEKKPKVYISVDGGCVQSVYSDTPVTVILLDWDNAEADDQCARKNKKIMRELTKNRTPTVF